MKIHYALLGMILGVTLALAIGSCSDVTTLAHSYVQVHGTVATGARTRTAVSGGYVGLVIPNVSQWTRLSYSTSSEIPNKAVTNSDGSYWYKIDIAAIESAADYPIFLAASDSAQTYTMFSQIPNDIAKVGAQLVLDINPTTTAASQLICPGGVYPPPSGAYCYSSPSNTSTTRISLIDAINASLAGANITVETTTPPNWQTFMTALLGDANLFSQVRTITTNAGLTSSGFTTTAIPSKVGASTIPKIVAPIAGIDDNTPAESSGSGGSGSCTATWRCTSSQCASVMGGYNGTVPGFSTSAACQSWCDQYIPGNCTCAGC